MQLTLMNLGPMTVQAHAFDDEDRVKLPPNVHIALERPDADLIILGEEGGEGVISVSVTNDGEREVLVIVSEDDNGTPVQPGKTLLVECDGHIEVRE